MRRKVKFFVSYAHRNKALVTDFLERLDDVLAPSKSFEYQRWQDRDLEVGEDWDDQIRRAIHACDVGILMISPAFLASKYITENELPLFVSGNKPSVPVMLQPVDFELHDLKGLEKKQIFLFDSEGFKKPRAYGECRDETRDAFVLELFRAIENKLRWASGTSAPSPVDDLRLFELGVEAYRRRGTPKYFLDSQSLSKGQRAEIYDRIIRSEKGRNPNNNPYK